MGEKPERRGNARSGRGVLVVGGGVLTVGGMNIDIDRDKDDLAFVSEVVGATGWGKPA